eukprot:484696-Amphidinium_carterae.1
MEESVCVCVCVCVWDRHGLEVDVVVPVVHAWKVTKSLFYGETYEKERPMTPFEKRIVETGVMGATSQRTFSKCVDTVEHETETLHVDTLLMWKLVWKTHSEFRAVACESGFASE